MAYSPLLQVMVKAAEKAARPLIRDFSEVDKLQISKKGAANFVTDADIRTEAILIEELGHARKNFGFIAEESGVKSPKEGDNHHWVIDPIDGTSNFIHAVPYFCISIAAVKLDEQGNMDPQAALIFDITRQEMFVAEKGQGAFLNDMRLRVSPRKEDLFLTTASARSSRDNFHEVRSMLEKVTATGATVRMTGAAALDLAYVAAGRFDGAWFHQLSAWDYAAGALLVREAGGRISDFAGDSALSSRDSAIVASNGAIHQLLLQLKAESAVL